MRWTVLIPLLCSGCASSLWNHRYIDCDGIAELYVEALDLDLSTGVPDRSDKCTLSMSGLAGSSADKGAKKIWIYDPRQLILLQEEGRPQTTAVWTFGAKIDLDRDDFLLELDTDRGKSSGHVTFTDAADPLTVNLRAGVIDDLEIETEGDVYLHLPEDGEYRFDIQSSSLDMGEFEYEEEGSRVFIITEGAVVIDDAIEQLPRD